MSYIGIPPQANFSSGLLDRFTSTTGTTVTLTHDIASENDIVVFVNFVKQDSTTYSVGGTGNKTLTLGGTLVSSDIVEVHYLNIVGQTNAPSSGSVGSSQVSADIITGQTALAVAPASTDELLISDGGVLKRIDVSLIGGQNTPAFFAYSSVNQALSNTTITKVTFDTEIFDSDSAYDKDTNHRFTPQEAGKYYIGTMVTMQGGTSALIESRLYIYKNGSVYSYSYQANQNNYSNYQTNYQAVIMDMNGSSDYVDIHAYISASGSTRNLLAHTKGIYFMGYKIIGA